MIRAFILSLALCAPGPAAGQPAVPPVTLDHPILAPLRNAQAYDCRQATCEQIRSCEEACYKLTVCGHSRRDGDGDGIPCENLCSRRC